MNAAPAFPMQARIAVSPYARRLARERALELVAVRGSGPAGRIVAVDILAYQWPVPETAPDQLKPLPCETVVSFSATVSLTDFYQIAAEVARIGLDIAIEDAVARAAKAALAGLAGRITLEADGRQIMISSA